VVKQERLAAVIALQRRITDEGSASYVGREVEVLVDGVSSRDPSRVVGKTQEFRTAVLPGEAAWTGSLRRMRVESARGVTLTGVPVTESVVAGV
jgi:tRNA-2-methylthio-N6-dimethylallyladenosine synthase